MYPAAAPILEEDVGILSMSKARLLVFVSVIVDV